MTKSMDDEIERDKPEMRRRVTLLTNVFPSPWLPTKGTFNYELARSVARKHSIRVINPISWTDEWQAGRAVADHLNGCRTETQSGIHIAYPRYYYSPKILRSQYDRFLAWSLAGTLRREQSEAPPEAVVAYWTHPDGTVALRWATKLNVPVWIMVGGSDVLILSNEPRRAKKLRETLQAADGIFVLSHNLRDKLLKWGLREDRVQVFRRGIDRQRFSLGDRAEARHRLGLDPSRPTFVWVGRMVPVKGLDLLLTAASHLAQKQPEFQLVLVGDGPLRSGLERQAEMLGIQGNVRFAGAVPHVELPEWYRAADWTVLSSHSEGIPNVLLESHACGTPFVATDVGGVAEIAQPQFDRLARAGEVESLQESLEGAIAGGESAGELRQALSQSVRGLEEAADHWMRSIFSSS